VLVIYLLWALFFPLVLGMVLWWLVPTPNPTAAQVCQLRRFARMPHEKEICRNPGEFFAEILRCNRGDTDAIERFRQRRARDQRLRRW